MSNKKRIVRLFIAAFIFALICASLVWQSVQADDLSVNRQGFIKLPGEILKENDSLSYSGESPEVIEYAHPLTVEFARQHGYWDPDDTRAVSERREIPEYSDALALWYANQNGRFSSESSNIDYAHPPLTVVYARQHGYGDPNDTRSVSEGREIPEYSDALALWYANQNGRLSSESSEVIEYAHPLTVEYARQHGYWDPDDTRAVSERREMPEYSNALELWYAQQYGNWNPDETVKRETE
jgi:DNA-directed RNA polymerase subunit F